MCVVLLGTDAEAGVAEATEREVLDDSLVWAGEWVGRLARLSVECDFG